MGRTSQQSYKPRKWSKAQVLHLRGLYNRPDTTSDQENERPVEVTTRTTRGSEKKVLSDELDSTRKSLAVVEGSLRKAQLCIQVSQQKLADTQNTLAYADAALEESHAETDELRMDREAVQAEVDDLRDSEQALRRENYCVLRVVSRKAQRAKAQLQSVRGRLHSIENIVPKAKGDLLASTTALAEADNTVTYYRHQNKAYQRKIHTLQLRSDRAPRAMQNAITPWYFHTSSPGSRARSRKERMLPAYRCVRHFQRAILEGGVAAKVQLGHEISHTATSGDGTTNCHINFDSRHIAMKVDLYLAEPLTGTSESSVVSPVTSSSIPKVRLLGVDSSVDHMSETQVSGWKKKISEISDTYSASPLAQRESGSFRPDDFALKLKGMNGDHAEDQRKTCRLMGLWKEEATFASLADTAILTLTWDELRPHVDAAVDMKMDEAGGNAMWEALAPEEKTVCDLAMMRALSVRLGTDMFARLPEVVQQSLKSLIWAGCSMHKEMNSVKGGDRTMQAAWKLLGLDPPILLANKDNAATLELASTTTEAVSVAEEHVLNVSGRGGVKTTSLAGAMFNHKDDKKGQQDTHQYYMRQVTGKPFMFPDTSNTRYQTNCDAATELLLNLDQYISFLELVRDRKDKRIFNHMEANVYAALHDCATLTELAVLVLYSQAITHPYVRVVRGSGTEQTNILDLGPVHVQVKEHVQRIIDDPELLLSPHVSHQTGATDGQMWEKPTAITTVHDLAPRLPYLKPITVAFFRGALETWERFTAEFSPGGLIDLASASKRESAWMPSTNDANEGALGSYRLHARRSPKGSGHLYNAQAMVARNNTEAFITEKFTAEEDHTFLRVQARLIDSSKLELQRRQAQIDFNQRVVDLKRTKDEDKRQKDAAFAEKIAELTIVLDPRGMDGLTVAELKLQLEWHRTVWDTEKPKKIPLKSQLKVKLSMRTALGEAVIEYKNWLKVRDLSNPISSIENSIDSIEAEECEMNE
ncbi:hypothetical protein B0H21DRAFT_820030 [Amylocystis lapponica]|nr:hypothetical protein B0H21DRAFT_820030 [Amylocystis lapponica]